MVDTFLVDLQTFLKAPIVTLNIAQEWAKVTPLEAAGRPLKDYLAQVGRSTIFARAR